MAGIYIHIPFCKQACYYCDFHFSTSLKNKDTLLWSLENELLLRKKELGNGIIDTIYFGGGTPSLLSSQEIARLINSIHKSYVVNRNPEITLEANPDDLSLEKLKELAASPINRLSIGIQSFFDTDLKLMNRAHNSREARRSVKEAQAYFENISIDLIYGIPNASDAQWRANIEQALAFKVPHISAYALTVEPRTALKSFIQKGLMPDVDEEKAAAQFFVLIDLLEKNGFLHYEVSNFGKKDFFSKNNTAYWTGKSYLGIGPSAHSYDGLSRKWNVRNNVKYIKALQKDKLPYEKETLTKTDRYNEYIMTSLRTMWGISLTEIANRFGDKYAEFTILQASDRIKQGLLIQEGETLKVSKEGKFLSDGIASDLFMIKLS
ncbi:radical SAM family heme chaperone HemW [Eudoraea chungangensis]|uniref:radical SAM family heme chaperone HemW n=1 Tax=Eudoraea chungangensis TaxID=1481905 RepID=UPI0023ED4ABD